MITIDTITLKEILSKMSKCLGNDKNVPITQLLHIYSNNNNLIFLTTDEINALKYTYKGISGLGEDGASVQPIYRYVDPTHVGILDLDASSNSDPGMSGMICPYTKIYNHSFSDYKEPDTWREQYQDVYKAYDERRKAGKKSPFIITNEETNKIPYEKFRKKIEEEELELHRLSYPIVRSDNPNIPWFPEGYFIDNSNKEDEETTSRFTITDEDTDEEYILKSDDEEDYYDGYQEE